MDHSLKSPRRLRGYFICRALIIIIINSAVMKFLIGRELLDEWHSFLKMTIFGKN